MDRQKKETVREPYGLYHGRRLPQEDAELTHVGPETPCGEYMRRFWQPVAMTSELGELPVAVRILGEDLVVFRDKSGRVGLLDRHCCHRGTSLEYGIVEDRGIRCCYHSWKFDVDGTILETPGEPADSKIKDKTFQGAYPALEFGGLVFAYMGPPALKPAFPTYDVFDQPDNRMVPYSLTYPCNWLQIFENAMDPAHGVFLHTRVNFEHFSPAWGELPVTEFRETPLGMIYITSRRIDDLVWVRMNDIMLPNVVQAGAIWEAGTRRKAFTRAGLTRWTVPIDDTHSLVIGVRHFNDGVNDPEGRSIEAECGKEKVDFLGQTGERPYEERQRVPGDFDAQVSQRPIALHALEHLGTTDRGVSMLRRIVRKGIRAVADGQEPDCVRGAPGTVISTNCQDSVVRVPARTERDDEIALRDVGRAIARIVVDEDNGVGRERLHRVAERIAALSEPAVASAAE
ncbi:MAG: aromatic ring-hydroxylating dioxygenase subunit alpha [Proteobacteria bacterium]|nr:aromatic ring-hydroxylating dioxygenase subunit alpha [Pseudomonadota bacterium]